MSGRVIFLLEEPSMKALLDGLLPRLMPGWAEWQHFQCIPHEGKSDLEKSIPIKLKAWREPGVRFVVVRDNDSSNCIDLKRRLKDLCARSGRPDTLVRLVCQELESWYLGDLEALARGLDAPNASTLANRKKFSNPDSVSKPSEQVRKLAPGFQKTAGARSMAQHLRLSENRSRSFQVFLQGLRRVETEMQSR